MPAENIGSSSSVKILFGPFELSIAERSLQKAGEAIPLGGRAFEILVALVEKAGEIVGKNELIAKVWPDVNVEEGSLRVHLSALRKALGEDQLGTKYIENVQGRGYRFVVPIKRQVDDRDENSTFSGASNLPPPLSRMIGRDDAARDIRAMLRLQRLTTILDAGGVGKTTVALAVGHAALPDFGGQVFFADFSAVRGKEQVIGAVATAIGLDPQFVDREEALARSLSHREALVILDSCEHLVKPVAEIAVSLAQRAPGVSVLVTSRQPLQVTGEHVFRLGPLDCPPEKPGQTAAEVLSYPAARLFVERVGARANDFVLRDDDASTVAEICRKLDGIPLAIELAAGRAAIFGVRDTIARLGSRLDLLKFGRRTANLRHQTLRATLDWSHEQLSDLEQAVLRRVGVFAGHFALEAALGVAAGEGMDESIVADAVGTLVEKSLIGAQIDSRGTFYRLLDTTRSYALEKLIASGEHPSVSERHADFLIQLLESNHVNLFELKDSDILADSARECLGNVRAALEWSFAPTGSDRIAVRLAAASAQLFLAMSLLLECRDWMEKAINRTIADRDAPQQVEILASLALSLMFMEGNSERVRDAFDSALMVAEEREDAYQQLRLLSGLSMYYHRRIDVAGAFELALRGEVVAKRTGNPDDRAIADSMLGAAYYMRGEHRRAQEHLERALQSTPPLRRFNATQYLFDLRTTSLFSLTRSYWFTGKLDRAVGCAKLTIEEAERSDHPIALSRALMLTMPLYFWIDDLQQVEKNLLRLELTAEKHSLMPFRAVALGLRGQYLVRTGHAMAGIEHLRDSLAKLALQKYEMLVTDFVSELAVNLAKQGERGEALTIVDESIAIQAKYQRPLHLPALLLAKGLTFASGDVLDTQSVEECLEEAMRLARQHSALSFELRAGLELARVWIGRGEVQRACDLVEPMYRQFSEGFTTPDLIDAKKMLESAGAMARQAK